MNSQTEYAPSFAEVALALNVMKAVEARYCPHSLPNQWTPNYEVIVDDLQAYQSGLCAAITQADEQDTKKPYRSAGINKTTEEGSPLYEFSKLQRAEDDRINYDNPRNDV